MTWVYPMCTRYVSSIGQLILGEVESAIHPSRISLCIITPEMQVQVVSLYYFNFILILMDWQGIGDYPLHHIEAANDPGTHVYPVLKEDIEYLLRNNLHVD